MPIWWEIGRMSVLGCFYDFISQEPIDYRTMATLRELINRYLHLPDKLTLCIN